MTGVVLLQLAPALIVVVALLLFRYPGERLIARARRCFAARGAMRAGAIVARSQRPRQIARGGTLLAHRISGRGPPTSA